MPERVRSARRSRTVAIGATLMAVTACGLGLWSARWRASTDRDSRAIRAYGGSQWAAAAELAPDPGRSQGRSGGAAALGPGIGAARSRRRRHGHLSASAR